MAIEDVQKLAEQIGSLKADERALLASTVYLQVLSDDERSALLLEIAKQPETNDALDQLAREKAAAEQAANDARRNEVVQAIGVKVDELKALRTEAINLGVKREAVDRMILSVKQ